MHVDYLEHHGILGQKWGIRRYQNPDGSLTEAGKKRYKDELAKKYAMSNQKNVDDVNEKYGRKRDELFKDSINKIKSIDPEIGAVVTMTDGRKHTSKDALDQIKNGLHVIDVRWMCYGNTLERILEMIDTTSQFGNIKEFEKVMNDYHNEYVEAFLKDAGEEITEVGKNLVDEILYNQK